MTYIDPDEDRTLAKDTPITLLRQEDLETYSVAALEARRGHLRAEIARTEQAITDKGAAKQSAESLFS